MRQVHAVAAAARGARGRDGWLLPSLFNVGLVEAQLGRHDAAVASFGAALALAHRVGDAAAAATAEDELARVFDARGGRRRDVARAYARALEFLARAVAAHPESTAQRLDEATTRWRAGREKRATFPSLLSRPLSTRFG